ncbi:MAG: ABC transporter substrate-binding protein [Hyphomicrobium sp.]|nr:ABC transporter substrate-binding protein [Hyphomicrobium sp.]
MRRVWAAAAIAGVLACAGAVEAQETVKVGVVLGLSGPPAIVDFGESYLQGLKLALKDHEAKNPKTKIDLIVYDDEANPQRAVSVVQRLIQNDRASIVVGTVSSGNVLAFAPILQRASIPLVAGPAIATPITTQFIDQKPSFIFRCSMVEKFQIDAILDWGVKTFKKIGLVHSTTGYGNVSAKEIEAGLKARGQALVAIEAAAPGVNDLTPQMIKMRDAGAELVLNFHESFELIYRPMARLNYRPAIAGNWGLSSLKVEQIVGKEAIEGTAMGQALDLADPKAKSFDERMRKEYGKDYRWPVLASLGYDASIDGIDAVSATPAKPFSSTDHECLDKEHVFLGVWKNGQVIRLKY